MKLTNKKPQLLALAATILVALSMNAGINAFAADQSAFPDVKATQPYYEDICWATEHGIVVGDQGQFKPDATITAEQFYTMLSRAIPESADENIRNYYFPKGSMSYHLRRSIQRGWTGSGSFLEYRRDTTVCKGAAWNAAFTAAGLQVYSSKLYGEKQSSWAADGMNAAKLLGFAEKDANERAGTSRAEAVHIIRTALENTKKMPEPEIVTQTKDLLIDASTKIQNSIYEDLMLVPDKILSAFRKDGWKISFDVEEIYAYSEKTGISSINGMTDYTKKRIYIGLKDALLHELGHYYQEKIRASGMDPNVYATFERIYKTELWSGSRLKDSNQKDGAEFFADAFAFMMTRGVVRSDLNGEDDRTRLESQRYFDDLAARGWIE